MKLKMQWSASTVEWIKRRKESVRINTGSLKLSGQKRTTKRVNKTYAVYGDIIKRNNL